VSRSKLLVVFEIRPVSQNGIDPSSYLSQHSHLISVSSLKIQKAKLDTINSAQVTSLDALENQLEESKEVLNKMKLNVRGEILGNLFDVILANDVDGNDILSDEEIDALIVSMEHLNGVDFNDELVKQTIIDKGRSIDAIMELVQNLLKEDVSERQKYFHVKKQ
jgi:hypothetical protein